MPGVASITFFGGGGEGAFNSLLDSPLESSIPSANVATGGAVGESDGGDGGDGVPARERFDDGLDDRERERRRLATGGNATTVGIVDTVCTVEGGAALAAFAALADD